MTKIKKRKRYKIIKGRFCGPYTYFYTKQKGRIMYNLIDENYFSEDRVCEMLNDVLKKMSSAPQETKLDLVEEYDYLKELLNNE